MDVGMGSVVELATEKLLGSKLIDEFLLLFGGFGFGLQGFFFSNNISTALRFCCFSSQCCCL